MILSCYELSASQPRSGRDVFKASVGRFYKRVALYAAGFPCTPFSALHSFSKLLEDKNAQQMWKCLQNIKESKPAVTCRPLFILWFVMVCAFPC